MATLKLTLREPKYETIVRLDCQALYNELDEHGPGDYNITFEDAKSLNAWVRRNTVKGLSQRQITVGGKVVGWRLELTDSVKRRT